MNVSIDRTFSKISFDHDCWQWKGRVDECGYGRTCFKASTGAMAHRVVYEALVGPIPPSMEIDHLCRNRGCVNPLHMEPVSHADNVKRGTQGRLALSRTHCPKGHEYTEANTRHGVSSRSRSCRACGRQSQRAHRTRTAARST